MVPKHKVDGQCGNGVMHGQGIWDMSRCFLNRKNLVLNFFVLQRVLISPPHWSPNQRLLSKLNIVQPVFLF